MRHILTFAVTLSLCVGFAQAADAPALVSKKEIALPGAAGFDLISIDGASRRLFIAHSTKIEVLDVDKGEKIGSVDGLEGAHMAVVVPAAKRGFATEGKRGKIAVFDAETYKVTKEIDAGEGPDAIVFVASVGEVWAMNHKAGTITCVDPISLDVKATIDVGGKLELAVEQTAKGIVFVNIEDKSTVAAIDAKKHAVTARYSLDPATEPTGIALDDANGFLFCGCAEKLAVLDAATGKVLATLPIGAHCDSVVFDAETRTVFASCGDGTTSAVRESDAKTFVSAYKLDTALGGKTCALDAKTHTLWVGAGTRGKDDLRVLEFGLPAAK